MPDYTLVDHADAMIAKLDDFDRVGVDTEFMREKTFFAELCLVQVSTGDKFYCVDPLNGDDLSGFWDSLMRPTWVLHSGRQDIEVVYQTARKMPASLFDTQIAAGLLGYAPQMGYATLVTELFKVEIPKSHTRANWSKRPLSDAYLEYAAEDVEYLLPAYEVLAEQLDRQDRLAWAEEDSATLLSPALYDVDPFLAIGRMKGARNLRGTRRAAAARLAAWRENEALRANRPRQWIVKDSALLELAATLPSSVDELEEIDDLSPGLIRRAGNSIVAARSKSRNRTTMTMRRRDRPMNHKRHCSSPCRNRLQIARRVWGLRQRRWHRNATSPPSFLTVIENSKVLNGWRRELIGEELLTLL